VLESASQPEQELGPSRILPIEKRNGALQQSQRRACVAASKSPLTGRAEAVGRQNRQRLCIGPDRPELSQVAESPFEVVPEDLFELSEPGTDCMLEPTRKALVQLGAELLRR